MTEAFNLLSQAEYLLAILNPLSRVITLEWTMFLLLALILVLLYLQTESVTMPFIVGITFIGAINASHLFSDYGAYKLIPEQMDWFIALLSVGALAFLMIAVWWKK